MKYVYEAILTPYGKGYEVNFPDLDIYTQGEDLFDAVCMAQDLLQLWISSTLKADRPLPPPSMDHEAPEDGRVVAVAVECDERVPEIETMSVQEAATVLDVSTARVYAMARDRILESSKVGNMVLISTESVRNRFNQPRTAGHPKKTTA